LQVSCQSRLFVEKTVSQERNLRNLLLSSKIKLFSFFNLFTI
jgi:hypothetical protein